MTTTPATTIAAAVTALIADLKTLPTLTVTNVCDVAYQVYVAASSLTSIPAAQVSAVVVQTLTTLLAGVSATLTAPEISLIQVAISTVPMLIADWVEEEPIIASRCYSFWDYVCCCKCC